MYTTANLEKYYEIQKHTSNQKYNNKTITKYKNWKHNRIKLKEKGAVLIEGHLPNADWLQHASILEFSVCVFDVAVFLNLL